MKSNDVSLDDVAKAAGVSPATASRALNGKAGVRDDLRDRVLLAADSLGYRPNRAAKNLAGGRTSVIGLVMAGNLLVDDVYAAALIQAVARAANEADEGLMLIWDSANPNETITNMISDGLVDGVIVSAVAVGERWVEDLLDAQMPTILLGSHPRRSDIPVVDVDQQPASAALVGHLLDTGCQQVATIAGPAGRVDTNRRLDGYHDAHHQRGLTAGSSLIFQGDFTYASGRRAADEVLDAVERSEIDGLFAANDEMAYAVLDRARERGIEVPEQLSVAGFDGITRIHPFESALTTAEQPFDEMARAAVASLVRLVNGHDVPQEQLIKAELVSGNTVRPVPRP